MYAKILLFIYKLIRRESSKSYTSCRLRRWKPPFVNYIRTIYLILLRRNYAIKARISGGKKKEKDERSS